MNTNASFRVFGCTCLISYILSYHTILANIWQGPVQPGSFLFHYGNKICYVNENSVTSSATSLPQLCIVYNLAGDIMMEVKRYGNALFLGDTGNSELERRLLNKNNQFIISYGSHYVGGLSVDWSANTVYWTESRDGTILAAYTEGEQQYITDIMNGLDSPTGLSVDPVNRHLYWAEAESKNRIMRSYPEGSGKTEFVTSNVGIPGDLVIGLGPNNKFDRLYWVDTSDNSIRSVNQDGLDPKVLVTRAGPLAGITVSQYLLSWAEKGSQQGLYWANKTDGTLIRQQRQEEPVSDIVYYGNYPRHNGAHGLCTTNNGGCPHVCLHTQYNRVCRCSFGYHTTDGGKTCTAEPTLTSSFLLVADIGWWDVFQVPLESTSGAQTATKVPLEAHEYPISVQFDLSNQIVYWINAESDTIMKSKLDGTEKRVVFIIPTGIKPEHEGTIIALYNKTNPQSLALDAESQTLYVTDSGRDVIFSVSTDGSGYKNITNTGLDRPRDIILDTKARHIYWTDWGNDPKIERANMITGLNRKALVNTVSAPSGLTADFEAGYLYWVDSDLNRVERTSLDGSGRRILSQILSSHLYDIALYGDYLYASDRQSRHLKRIHKDTGSFEEWGPGLFQAPFQVKVVIVPTVPTTVGTTPSAVESSVGLPVVIGASIGGVVVVIIIIAVIIVCCRRQKRLKQAQTSTGFENPGYNGAISQTPGGASGNSGSVSSRKSTTSKNETEQPYNQLYGKNWNASKSKKSSSSSSVKSHQSGASVNPRVNVDPGGSVTSRNTDISALTYGHSEYNIPDDVSTAGTVSSRSSDMTSVSVSSTKALFSKPKKH